MASFNTYLMRNTHTHPFNGHFSGTTWVSRYQKGKTNLDFTEARDSEWQWHQQVCTSLQTDNHASTPPLSFLQVRCPSCHPANRVKALKAYLMCKCMVNRYWLIAYLYHVTLYTAILLNQRSTGRWFSCSPYSSVLSFKFHLVVIMWVLLLTPKIYF